MSENLAGEPIRQTYEQIRDGLRHNEARALWKDADRHTNYAREAMQRVHDDESLSEEGKRQQAQQVIEANAEQIQKSYEGARNQLASAAESAWKFSIPFPDGKALATTAIADSNELIAIQNESAALAQRIEATSLQQATRERSNNPRSKGIKPTRDHKVEVLRAEYGEALEQGGFEGRIRAMSVKRFCDGHGVDFERVVDPFRKDVHRRAYQDAAHYEQAASVIPSGKRTASNPYDEKQRRRGPSAIGAYRSGNTSVGASGRPQLFQKKKRKPNWK